MARLIITRDEKITAANNMIQYGGSFMKALGETLIKADDLNVIKIYSMWKEDIDKYLKFNEK